MSIHLHIDKQKQKEHARTNLSEEDDDDSRACGSASDSSSDDDDDQNFDDWDDSLFSGSEYRIQSLFDEAKSFGNVQEVLKYDKETYGVDLDELWTALKGKGAVDAIMGRVKLVNWIRKTKPTPDAVRNLTGNEDFFRSDEYLVPVIENDALLQYTPPNDKWSDDSDLDDGYPTSASTSAATRPTHLNPHSAETRIKSLEKKLAQVKKDFDEYRGMVREKMNLREAFEEARELEKEKDQGKDAIEKKQREKRDDDSHYFESYGYNDIHAVMIQDKIRTSTYAKFILTNPELFEGATVLDVGCGTGILSLFAARSGAKRVYAVDASPVGAKAEEIVRLNGLDNVIKVIRGKIEDVELPFSPEDDKKVDIIISEWMGYALLYESMLDSVLVAKERFLRTGGGIAVSGEEGTQSKKEKAGLMVPSECKMMLGLCDAGEVKKERVHWWNDVYGFDMSPMTTDIYTEAVMDVVGPHTLLSNPICVKDLHVQTLPPVPTSSTSTSHSTHPHHPLIKFVTPFTLTSVTSRKTTVTAFVLYFDTFFTTDGSLVPPDVPVEIVREGESIVAEVWPLGGGKVNKTPGLMKRRKSSGSGSAMRSQSREREKEKEQRDEAITNETGTLTTEPSSMTAMNEGTQKVAKVTSFSTGPQSIPTHWKQTLFLLREPFVVEEGSTVAGNFICRKSEDNSRELEVEIHYSVRHPGVSNSKIQKGPDEDEGEDVIVQMFKVR
ncbi:S-adenosyl-L-methionine-dependent methyltransferase [Dendrothele bispora CBS 962.96]|uniref:type I protein arginine methyltransferase n=1 Tax=Dendrothele bispora (strain CBS 962.96) TaxID=1314807 RepID=A0A4S8M819_DENBC|nr:S-adenosyl-L-methionine-dependent methyltransferase [Dendrothele bispora CBS 962.96]